MDILSHILKSKLPENGEIAIIFFESCNLQCPMCPQDHSSLIGLSKEEILSKVEIIKNFFSNSHRSSFTLNIMGGELFQDSLLEEYLPVYSLFIEQVSFLAQQMNKSVDFNFLSNLVFTKTHLVKEWLLMHNLKLSVSYDRYGRFNKTNLLIFKSNIEKLKDVIRNISMVVTHDAIKTLMTIGDPYFNYLYKTFNCYWDHLVPFPGIISPTKKELYDFNIFLLENYPECTNLTAFINKQSFNKMNPELAQVASDYILITPTDVSTIYHIYEHSFQEPSVPLATSTLVTERFLNEYKCLNCEYYSRCPLDCLMRDNWVDPENVLNGCIYSETFKYVESKWI